MNEKSVTLSFLKLKAKETVNFSKIIRGNISRNGNPKKTSYISGNGTFLYFRKGKP